jgi:hypothetical protein
MDSNNRYCLYTDDIVIDGVCKSSDGGYTETTPYPPKMARNQGRSIGTRKSDADQIREINKKSEYDRNEIIKYMILIIILFIIILLYTIRKNPDNLIYSIGISFLYTGIIVAVLIGLAVLGVGVFMGVMMANSG